MNGRKRNAHVAPLRRRRGSRLKSAIFFLFFLAFVGGGVYFGFIFLVNLKGVLASLGQRFDLPVSLVAPDSAPDWSGKERVNILLLGLDRRLDEEGQPSRSDTMLVITVDPETKTAGMLSIPRDLYVPIPISDKETIQGKINSAYFFGDYYKVDGGGPGLAKKTVQYNFGIKIHYYAQVDFEGFQKIVDTLGGITVDVDFPLKDNEYPTPYYGYRRVFIPLGLQHMNGETALQYARSRHQDSDFGRTHRQQKVLVAIRDKALQLNLLPKLPKLIGDFKDTVSTDMSPTDMIALANLGKQIDTSTMVVRTIEYPAVTSMSTESAGDILLPVRPEIAKIVADVFGDAKQQEQLVKVEVVNGTRTPGMATKVGQFLKDKGIDQIELDALNDSQETLTTTVISYKGKKDATKQIASWLAVPESNIQWKDDKQSQFDVRIIIGKDFKLPSS